MAGLYDALDAKYNKGKCTLLLACDDVSYSFAMCGLNILGRERYGVLRLDTDEDFSLKKIPEIMGLEYNKVCADIKNLRYGNIMIIGNHNITSIVKVLLVNFINYYWPELIEYDGFVKSAHKTNKFINVFPIPICSIFKKNNTKTIKFYNKNQIMEWLWDYNGTTDFQNDIFALLLDWCANNDWELKNLSLGEYTAKEAKSIFSDYTKSRI